MLIRNNQFYIQHLVSSLILSVYQYHPPPPSSAPPLASHSKTETQIIVCSLLCPTGLVLLWL